MSVWAGGGNKNTDPHASIDSVEKYQAHFTWLKDVKFLQDLENDSVDSELLEEELTALQEEEILTNRQKLVKCLQSNPVQILLCVVVLLDAGIVIAQILLDLHSVREKLHRREDDLARMVHYLKITHPGDLNGYDGYDLAFILAMLEENERKNNLTTHGNSDHHVKRSTGYADNPRRNPVHVGAPAAGARESHDPGGKYNANSSFHIVGKNRTTNGKDSPSLLLATAAVAEHEVDLNNNAHMQPKEYDSHHTNISSACPGCARSPYALPVTSKKTASGHQFVMEDENDTLHEVAHGLHFASIALLGFLVLEDFVKIMAMGKNFCRHKIEIFDAIIITSSFLFDIIFLGGVTGEEGEKAAAVLVVLLLWRVTRVVDGILITSKQRQEFRIRLQKRARRKAEKRADNMEEEKHTRNRQIAALKDLCSRSGIDDDDIDLCTPKRKKNSRRVSNTYCALSSVARLSVSMTMSMSSGLFSMGADDTDGSDGDRSDHSDRKELGVELLRSDTGAITSKMSDIEEEETLSNRDDLELDSPINNSGIRIIIDEGSSDESDVLFPPIQPPKAITHNNQNNSTDIEMREMPDDTTYTATVTPTYDSSPPEYEVQPCRVTFY